jgi:hypothetical protein
MNTTRYFRVNVNEYQGNCFLTYELLVMYLDSCGIKKDDPKIPLIINGDDIEIDGKIMKFIEDKKEKTK